MPTISQTSRAVFKVTAYAAMAFLACGSARALGGDGSWVYRRSYFSHNLTPEEEARYPQPESRSAYRVPYSNESPGFGIRGVHRYNAMILFDGRSNDITIFREDWRQIRP